MSDQWYYKANDTEHGPVSIEELGQKIADSESGQSLSVRHADDQDWRRAEDVAELVSATNTTADNLDHSPSPCPPSSASGDLTYGHAIVFALIVVGLLWLFDWSATLKTLFWVGIVATVVTAVIRRGVFDQKSQRRSRRVERELWSVEDRSRYLIDAENFKQELVLCSAVAISIFALGALMFGGLFGWPLLLCSATVIVVLVQRPDLRTSTINVIDRVVGEPDSQRASDESSPTCPSCGSSYGWNGTCCAHCQHGMSQNGSADYGLTLNKVTAIARKAGGPILVVVIGLCVLWYQAGEPGRIMNRLIDAIEEKEYGQVPGLLDKLDKALPDDEKVANMYRMVAFTVTIKAANECAKQGDAENARNLAKCIKEFGRGDEEWVSVVSGRESLLLGGHDLVLQNFVCLVTPATAIKEMDGLGIKDSQGLARLRSALVAAEQDAKDNLVGLAKALSSYHARLEQFEADSDHDLTRLTLANKTLLSGYAVFWSDLREWTYSAQVFARRAESGEMLLESFLRGLNGDPFGTYHEFRGRHDAGTIALHRLADRLSALNRRTRSLIKRYESIHTRYFPERGASAGSKS